jgi:uncharacterized protein (TIGR02145 family)
MDTIIIGNQEWTTVNSNLKTFRNGDLIPEVKDFEEWRNTKSPACCYYNNDIVNSELSGLLYNGYAILDSRNLAPEGFRIPTNDDFVQLIKNMGSEDYGFKLKTKLKGHWKNMKGVKKGTNELGFNAFPSGMRTTLWGKAPFVNQNEYTRFWTVTKKEDLIIFCAQLGYGDDRLYVAAKFHSEARINDGCSLRFIKEN